MRADLQLFRDIPPDSLLREPPVDRKRRRQRYTAVPVATFLPPSSWIDSTRSTRTREAWQFAQQHLGDMPTGKSGKSALDHALRVATIVRNEFGERSCTLVALALLHDVLEDSRVSIDCLKRHFQQEVVDGVVALTKPLLGSKTSRRELYHAVICRCPDSVKTVKIADYIDNLRLRRGLPRGISTRRGAETFLSRLTCVPQSSSVQAAMRHLRAELSKCATLAILLVPLPFC